MSQLSDSRMKKKTIVILLVSHVVALVVGFAGGIYALPILIAPPAPNAAMVELVAEGSEFAATFSRDRQDSDAFHWGEGEVSISTDVIAFVGQLAPGPDYRLYLSPEFVETESAFNQLKPFMVYAGDIKTFENFIIPLRGDIDPSEYSAVIVWCESFGQFITSGSYEKKTH